jgi:hypothetical protein
VTRLCHLSHVPYGDTEASPVPEARGRTERISAIADARRVLRGWKHTNDLLKITCITILHLDEP